MEGSAAADWLEEVRDDLTGTFGMNPNEGDKIWGNVSFLSYIWPIIDTLKRMRKENTLPRISTEAHIRASREWRVPRSPERQRVIHALETFTYAPFRDFETLLEGALGENDRAKNLCLGEITKLLRMIRLSR
jgi:hypothetical protein